MFLNDNFSSEKLLPTQGDENSKRSSYFLCLTHHGENCDISEGDNSEYGYDPG